MANLEGINLEKRRKKLIYRQIAYLIVFFFYTLLVIFAFHFNRQATGLDDGDGYYIIAYFLLPHHIAYLLSLLLSTFSWAFNQSWLAVTSIVVDCYMVLYLAYACWNIWSNPGQLNVLLILVTTGPLILFALFNIDQVVQKVKAYLLQRQKKSSRKA